MSRHNHQQKPSFSTPMFQKHWRGLISVCASALTLSACGNGGGGAVSTSNTNTPPPVSAVATTGDAIAPIVMPRADPAAAPAKDGQKARGDGSGG